MITEYIRYNVPAERADELVVAYRTAQASLRASPHCLDYELSRCTDAPSCFILQIHWDSADGHMRGFRSSPEFQTFLTAVRPFIPFIEEMRHYEPTDVQSDS